METCCSVVCLAISVALVIGLICGVIRESEIKQHLSRLAAVKKGYCPRCKGTNLLKSKAEEREFRKSSVDSVDRHASIREELLVPCNDWFCQDCKRVVCREKRPHEGISLTREAALADRCPRCNHSGLSRRQILVHRRWGEDVPTGYSSRDASTTEWHDSYDPFTEWVCNRCRRVVYRERTRSNMAR